MKRALTILASIAALLIGIEAAAQNTVTKKYDYKGFNSIEVSSFFNVTVEKSKNYSVKAIVSEEYEEYLEIRLKGNELSIGFRSLPAKLLVSSVSGIASVKVSMPELSRVELSGSSKLSCNDNFDLGRGVFNLSVSGASCLEALSISASEGRIYASGASKSRIDGDFVDLTINNSGTARIEGDLSAEDFEIKSSGTSVLDIEGKFEDLDIYASGVSNVTILGLAESIDINASGTASVDASKLAVKEAEVKLSAASVAKVNASRTLEVSASGTSRCSYKDNDRLQVIEKGISRASVLRAE